MLRMHRMPPTKFFALAVALGVVLCGLFFGGVARADDELAREHFRRGVKLYDGKKYAEAEEAFREAYGEKPSPGIKQNIALALKGQGKLVEAATFFDEALDEGRDSLKPEVKTAIQHELGTLEKSVATILIAVVSADTKQAIDGATVSVDGVDLAHPARKRPVRLVPGIHVFSARAPGYTNPPDKKLSLVAGSPVDASFELARGGASAAASGTLVLRAEPDAVLRVDGTEVGRGTWTGSVASGTHRVEASLAGKQPRLAEVAVTPGTTVEYPFVPSDAPAPYEAPDRKPPRPKKFYVVPAVAAQGQSLRLSEVLGEPPNGKRRSFGGFALGVRGGYRIVKTLALELHGEIGTVNARYRLQPNEAESVTQVGHWQLTPGLRFVTPGKVRFTAGSGFGVHGTVVDATVVRGGTSVKKKGSGVAASWLLDLGLQFDVGPLFLEGVLFFDVHGVGTARDDTTEKRFFHASPSTRIGARIGLGIQF